MTADQPKRKRGRPRKFPNTVPSDSAEPAPEPRQEAPAVEPTSEQPDPSSGLTPTELRILNRLSDGQWHPTQDLLTCLGDDLAEDNAFHAHIHRLRIKLRSRGEDISGETNYRLVNVVGLGE